MDMHTAILEVIRQNGSLLHALLNAGAGRTHAFLGSRKSLAVPPVFSRLGEYDLQPCILTQVYQRLHNCSLQDIRGKGEPLVFFEAFRLDCTYLAGPRTFDAKKFPVSWENDWVIEVENDWPEAAMTLRSLLDVVTRHRLGIFFKNSPNIDELSKDFRKSWETFISQYPFATGFDLQVIVFPESYSSFDEYAKSSRSCVWDSETHSFRCQAAA